jgi:hypothetical protein
MNTKVQIQQWTEKLVTSGGKITTKVDSKGNVIDHGTPKGLPRKTAKRIARQFVLKKLGYTIGSLGQSEFAKLSSRQDRRELAKLNKEEFTPQYNGNSPKTHKEVFGVGYERFNSKYVTVSK